MRDERGARWFDDLRADVRYAVKGMRRNPGFILAATLTLGLGIGVNGIIFGYVNSILFRPVPVQAPEELAALFTRDTRTGHTGAARLRRLHRFPRPQRRICRTRGDVRRSRESRRAAGHRERDGRHGLGGDRD